MSVEDTIQRLERLKQEVLVETNKNHGQYLAMHDFIVEAGYARNEIKFWEEQKAQKSILDITSQITAEFERLKIIQEKCEAIHAKVCSEEVDDQNIDEDTRNQALMA